MNYDELMTSVKKRFERCDDFVCRTIENKSGRFFVCFIREICDRGYISDKIIKPIVKAGESGKVAGFENLLCTTAFGYEENSDVICEKLCSGNAFVLAESSSVFAALVPADSYFASGYAETDITVKGPKSGFTEDVEKNISVLRRRLRTDKFKCEAFVCGSVSKSRVALLYMDGRAEAEYVDCIRKKISDIKAKVIADSGNIELLIKEKKYSFFPSFGSTEKVDKVASLLATGRIAIICDGSPFVLTAPYVFIEAFQSAEDYLRTPYYATFSRILRLIAFLCALYLPSVFLIVSEERNELLPKELLEVINTLRRDIPIPLFWEILIMLTVFEILREVGVRMPKTVGDAVGIVGSIIIGDAATKAGIASTSVILVVAVSAVANFVVPAFMNNTTLLRFVFLIFSQLGGVGGLAAASAGVVVLLFAKSENGIWYMSPIMPLKKEGLLDFIIAVPSATLGRKEKL